MVHLDHLPKSFHLKAAAGSPAIGAGVIPPFPENIAHRIRMNSNFSLLIDKVSNKGIGTPFFFFLQDDDLVSLFPRVTCLAPGECAGKGEPHNFPEPS